MKKIKLVLAACLLAICLCSCAKEPEPPARSEAYISSDSAAEIEIYHGEIIEEKNIFGKIKNRTVQYTPEKKVIRGISVVKIDAPETDEEGNILYEKIELEGTEYYIPAGHLTEDKDAVATEKEMFVRTSVTLLEDTSTEAISGFARKGSRVEVLGYEGLNPDGSVIMYKIKAGSETGWVFGKYLVFDQETADAVYNEELGGVKIADYHAGAVYAPYENYGGDPRSLDYYPYEKPSFEDNPLLTDARSMYLGVGCSYDVDYYIQVAKEYGVNAMCVDIKDDVVGFESDAVKKYSPSTYEEYTYYGADSYGDMIRKIKDAGIYVIGRIVCFNDDYYAQDHPEDCIDYYGPYWPSAFDRDIWEYKVSLAVEAVEKFGFNEIQLDYVRFPEGSASMTASGADYKNYYDEAKCEAVQNFVRYAADMIHRAGAYISIDVFGEASMGYVTEAGQYWPALSNIVDAMSAMPYTDHFWRDPDNWEHPYYLIKEWASTTAMLQSYTPLPAVARTWVTAYDTPWWESPENRIYYGPEALADQAQALWDAGLTGGFLTWNIACDLSRYNAFSWAWARDYTQTTGTVFY